MSAIISQNWRKMTKMLHNAAKKFDWVLSCTKKRAEKFMKIWMHRHSNTDFLAILVLFPSDWIYSARDFQLILFNIILSVLDVYTSNGARYHIVYHFTKLCTKLVLSFMHIRVISFMHIRQVISVVDLQGNLFLPRKLGVLILERQP